MSDYGNLPVDIVFVRHGESEGNLAEELSHAGDESYYEVRLFLFLSPPLPGPCPLPFRSFLLLLHLFDIYLSLMLIKSMNKLYWEFRLDPSPSVALVFQSPPLFLKPGYPLFYSSIFHVIIYY